MSLDSSNAENVAGPAGTSGSGSAVVVVVVVASDESAVDSKIFFTRGSVLQQQKNLLRKNQL